MGYYGGMVRNVIEIGKNCKELRVFVESAGKGRKLWGNREEIEKIVECCGGELWLNLGKVLEIVE